MRLTALFFSLFINLCFIFIFSCAKEDTKLAIFGSTGGLGQHIVKAAINAGHSVAGIARNSEEPTNKLTLGNDITDGVNSAS